MLRADSVVLAGAASLTGAGSTALLLVMERAPRVKEVVDERVLHGAQTLGTLLWSIDLHQDQGFSVEFSQDGSNLIGAVGSSARIWPMTPDPRSLDELDAFAACRIEYTLARGRLERANLDYHACQPH